MTPIEARIALERAIDDAIHMAAAENGTSLQMESRVSFCIDELERAVREAECERIMQEVHP